MRTLVLLAVGCLDASEPGNLVPPTVIDDPSLPRIEVNGTTLHAQDFGEPGDPMIVVLHGGPGGDHRSLLQLADLAGDGYHVVFWDQRGSGLSERHDPDVYGYDLILDDLEQVVEHHTISADQPVLFVGHSWGAMYATWYLDERGDLDGRIRGAVLSEPGAFTSEQLEDYLARLFGSMELFGESLNDAAWLGQFMTPSDHARADYHTILMAPEGSAVPIWRFGAVINRTLVPMAVRDGFDWTDGLGDFDAPVLFLRGDSNPTMPLWHQEELAAAYPSASVVTIEDAGHEMIWERPDAYLGHVRTYLSSLDLGGAQ